ncbi:calcium-binding protein CP1-like [Malus sylvestris]|uniref:calcium-binding protein CP1-like n=1 Tax=Malus sylvestris TaxID=3752 RepID=UPI0021ABCFEB|nr:calcium-binding protein CP1-like [Malus sylvestris]
MSRSPTVNLTGTLIRRPVYGPVSSQSTTTARWVPRLVSTNTVASTVSDVDHDDKISKDDLRAFYAGFSSSAAEENLTRLMMSTADKDGFVQYEEFEHILACDDGAKSPGVMEDVFKVMDKDGDGKLSHEENTSFFFIATDEDIKAMIKLGGSDENQGVTYAGLLKILAVDQVSEAS